MAQGKALLLRLLLPLRVPESAAEAVPPPWPPEALGLPVTLCVDDAVVHLLMAGETVAEWLSLGEREEQPVCEGEGVGAALADAEAVCEVTQRSVAGLQVACSLQFTDAE